MVLYGSRNIVDLSREVGIRWNCTCNLDMG
jgi:hypothetical protein